ncbi:hypothetical protein HOD20_08490 [archaeon]|nr:hypothetical protein [archaeon]MBT4648568.1 hypothetical protein [archaeon]MBT6821429.1 hypothetical protein [archaeon]MBT7393024.1 hypothetical protein [archaeon]
MGISKNNLIFFSIVFILSISFAHAAVIGVSPSVFQFRKMVKDGYAESEFLVTSNEVNPITGSFRFEGEIADWMSIDAGSDEFEVSLDEPFKFKLIIRPPANARNDNYTGIMRLTSSPLGEVTRGAGSAVIAAIAIRVDVEITGEEIIDCRAGALQLSTTEIGLPYVFTGIIYNDGNVRIRPEVIVDIYDQNRLSVLQTKNFLGSQILPTTSDEIRKELDNDLEMGQYFADILVTECAFSHTVTFDVVEKGGIADKGNLMVIRVNEYSIAREPTQVIPMFRNEGPRKVFARFKGNIVNTKTGKIAEIIETDELEVLPGQVMNFPFFFVPKSKGEYVVSGRFVYNKKITFEEKSEKITVVKGEGSLTIAKVFLFFLYLIIGLVIFIIFGLIKKEKKKKEEGHHGRKKIKW